MIRIPGKNSFTTDRRYGVSLIETTMALALTALLMVPVVGLLRTNRELWEKSDSNRTRTTSIHGTLRHISRKLRTAQTILAMETRPGKPSQLQIRTVAGQVLTWKHDPRSGEVTFHTPTDSGVLADSIRELKFEGLASNGKSTTDLRAVQTLRCTASVNLIGKNNAVRSSTSTSWIRPNI